MCYYATASTAQNVAITGEEWGHPDDYNANCLSSLRARDTLTHQCQLLKQAKSEPTWGKRARGCNWALVIPFVWSCHLQSTRLELTVLLRTTSSRGVTLSVTLIKHQSSQWRIIVGFILWADKLPPVNCNLAPAEEASSCPLLRLSSP